MAPARGAGDVLDKSDAGVDVAGPHTEHWNGLLGRNKVVVRVEAM